MPRERHEFFRESNTNEKERIVVLAFEGNITEEKYFEEFRKSDKFNDDLIYLHLLTRQEEDTRSAPKQVFEQLKKEARDEYNFGSKDELWMIIDTDRWKNIPQIVEACKKQNNMFVAVSNPCFEFWLLLHVKDIQEYSPQEQLNLLTNKKVSNRKRYIDKQIEALIGVFNKLNPRPELFLPHLVFAVEQARKLDNLNEDFPSALGSHIYKLIEKIAKD